MLQGGASMKGNYSRTVLHILILFSLVTTLLCSAAFFPRTSAETLRFNTNLDSNQWYSLASLPMGIGYFGMAQANGKIYTFGGENFNGYYPIPTTAVLEYNPVTNTWLNRSQMPQPLQVPAASLNGKIYLAGGNQIDQTGKSHAISTVEEYDPAANTWIQKADLPSPRMFNGVTSLNGKLYVIGGLGPNSEYTNTVYAFDPGNNSWSEAAPMPTSRDGVGAVASNGKIFAIGGNGGTWLSTVEVFDPVANTWSTKKSMPIPLADMGNNIAESKGQIYIVGGCTGRGSCSMASNVVVYDVATDTWGSLPNLPIARTSGGDTIINGILYAIGGYNYGTFYNNVYAYNLPCTICGSVVDKSGNGIAGVSISDGAGDITTTDSSGNYAISGIASGMYTITPSLSGYTFFPAFQTISAIMDKSGIDFAGYQNPPSQSSCPVFYYQKDPRWEEPLGGNCTYYYSRTKTWLSATMANSGCAITSTAMLFSYFGVDLTPMDLNDQLGGNACPFSWSAAANLTGGKVTFVKRIDFAWKGVSTFNTLSNQVAQQLSDQISEHPVILGLINPSSLSTHFVLVTNESGSDPSNPSNYIINDPAIPYPSGQGEKLSFWTGRLMTPKEMIIYEGAPSCTVSALQSQSTGSFSPRAVVSQPLQGSKTGFAASSSASVEGGVQIMDMGETTLTVAAWADSNAANITQMHIWSDTDPVTDWQTFSTIATVTANFVVYAQFKDSLGNTSEIYSTDIFGTAGDSTQTLYLPILSTPK
jgi:N-acetylneuraminic acid mutarotase